MMALDPKDVTIYKTKTYQEISAECRGAFAIAWPLVVQMYYRLTRVDRLKYRPAVSRIYSDHKDLFSRKQLVRHLPQDDPTVERRIRTKSPKSSIANLNHEQKISSAKLGEHFFGSLTVGKESETLEQIFTSHTKALDYAETKEDRKIFNELCYDQMREFTQRQRRLRVKEYEHHLTEMRLHEQDFEARRGFEEVGHRTLEKAIELQQMAIQNVYSKKRDNHP